MGNHASSFDSQQPERKLAGLYIHVPFCKTICPYCDFYSIISPPEQYEAFIGALAVEADLKSKTEYGEYDYDTVFLGGGTPSTLNEYQISRLFTSIRRDFKINADAEITIECNPSSLTENKLRAYRDNGINRISLGVQSFNDVHLRKLGRLHGSAGARKAYDSIRNGGFENVSIDLIYGLPHQTIAEWRSDLECAIELKPDHVSAYNLIIEPDTPFGNLFDRGKLPLPSEEEQAGMYNLLNEFLNNYGMARYEISNFARDSCHCRHNLKYWRCEPYLGLGPSGVSYDGKFRRKNIADLSAYCRELSQSKSIYMEIEELDKPKLIEERIMMSLRLTSGLDFRKFKSDFGVDIFETKSAEIKRLIDTGYLSQRDNTLALTEKALFISNEIILKLI